MSAPLSPHYPAIAGGVESVTGELTIDTGLREIQSLVACLRTNNIVANEESLVSWYAANPASDPTRKVTLRVEKGGTNHGTIGDSAVDVSWMALGK